LQYWDAKSTGFSAASFGCLIKYKDLRISLRGQQAKRNHANITTTQNSRNCFILDISRKAKIIIDIYGKIGKRIFYVQSRSLSACASSGKTPKSSKAVIGFFSELC
jgi:hypothetical protein